MLPKAGKKREEGGIEEKEKEKKSQWGHKDSNTTSLWQHNVTSNTVPQDTVLKISTIAMIATSSSRERNIDEK